MKLTITRTLLTIFLGAALFSCTRDGVKTGGSDDPVPVKIVAGVPTRVHDTVWDENDAIGLAMLEDDGSLILNDVYNYHYITPSGQGEFEPASPAMTAYFPQDGNPVTFRAYYPYFSRLDRNMIVPISVTEQAALPDIDFMTAEHISGRTKADPEVHLTFHHRLSKMIFNLTADDEIDLTGATVTIHGMQTTGSYDMLNEILNVDPASTADLEMVTRNGDSQVYGIVLPRSARSGVTFDFKTAAGAIYSAPMSDTLNINSGVEYTFNVKLNSTEVKISAEIAPWITGPESTYSALQVTAPVGENDGINVGDRMNVYMNEGSGYDLLTTFTYLEGDRWKADDPVYWETLPDPADLRASMELAPALNTSQLPDIVVAPAISVPANSRVHFALEHAASKVIVRLTSNTFETADLASATITLPGYYTGGYEENGAFVPGTATGNITVDRTDTDNGIALFQPQTIASGDPVVRVTINGRAYDAPAPSGGFTYEGGTAYTMIVTVDKTGVGFSAEIVPWDTQTVPLTAILFTTPAGVNENIPDQAVMTVYTGNSAERTELGEFRYTRATDTWVPESPIYWESLPDNVTFYASIFVKERYNTTLLDDHLTAMPVDATTGQGVHFTLTHPQAKVVVELESDGSYTDEELAAMTLTLPGYATGGQVDTGVFVYGDDASDITVAKNVGENNDSSIALIQPQTIAEGRTVISIGNGSGTVYNATYDGSITFNPNVSTVLKIKVTKSAVELSARVVDWVDGDVIPLTATALKVSGQLYDTDDFFRNKTIHVYRLSDGFLPLAYTFKQGNPDWYWQGNTLYWDDQTLPLTMTAAFFPDENNIPGITSSTTTFPWSVGLNQGTSYSLFDLLMDNRTVTAPQYINFDFRHMMAMVQVNISSEFYTADELAGAVVTLKDLFTDANVNLSTLAVTATGTKNDIIPYTNRAGVQYTAIAVPQTVQLGEELLSITLPGYNQPFTGPLDKTLNLRSGEIAYINVVINKTAIEMYATVQKWVDGDTGEIIIQ